MSDQPQSQPKSQSKPTATLREHAFKFLAAQNENVDPDDLELLIRLLTDIQQGALIRVAAAFGDRGDYLTAQTIRELAKSLLK
jgi:hypothetical protein